MEGLSAENIMVMPRYNMLGKMPYSHVTFVEEIEGVEQVMIMDLSNVRLHRKHDGWRGVCS